MSPDLCRYLDWDSDFFNLGIGRLLNSKLDSETADAALRWCDEQAIDCLYFLARSDDSPTARAAEEHGFQFVDIRLTLECPSLARWTSPAFGLSDRVRLSQREDIDHLKRLARENHTDTRFFFDTRFPRDKAALLYEVWIEKSCSGTADAVLIYEYEGRAAGYITCHKDSQSTGSIGLVGVDAQVQGRGIGKSLVEEALRWFAQAQLEQVTVVTQGRNIRAQRLYQHHGFITKSVELWYHRWFER